MNGESQITQLKLTVILQRCLVELRNLALGEHCQQIHDLADATEIIPALMTRWEDGHLDVIRAALAGYESKYRGTYGYLSILNMDEADFRSSYLMFEEIWKQCEVENQRIVAKDPAA